MRLTWRIYKAVGYTLSLTDWVATPPESTVLRKGSDCIDSLAGGLFRIHGAALGLPLGPVLSIT